MFNSDVLYPLLRYGDEAGKIAEAALLSSIAVLKSHLSRKIIASCCANFLERLHASTLNLSVSINFHIRVSPNQTFATFTL